MMRRGLIVNADDFGLSTGVNAGIIAAHERGIVTSASLMVDGRHASEAARYARTQGRLDLGLHIDLGEWRYRDQEWSPAYERVNTSDATAVGAEIERQLDLFVKLVGSFPSHLDSHQHVHLQEPAASIVAALGRRIGVVVRDRSEFVRYEGGFYGQTGKGEPWPDGITVQSLCAILRGLPAGVTELGCHPGLADASGSTYGAERDLEVSALCEPEVRALLDDHRVDLITFAGLSRFTHEVASVGPV
ncbi:MAG TPA: ChbG/HpnK family deacetylase [Baekduia sp.]|nr:ChbG/HpnK family deacetylase [Baekduia sp.]